MTADVMPFGQEGGGFGPFPTGLTAIYALHDPRNGRVRYVGMSAHPARRLIEHRKPSRLVAKTHKNTWIKSLLRLGLVPTLSILETVQTDHWQDAERRWILAFGPSLTNGAAGGRGGGITPEVRAKISQRHRGKVVSEETRRRIGATSRGRKHSDETLAKMAAAARGRAFSPEHRAKLSERAKQREARKTPEQRAAIAEKIRTWVLAMPDETRRRMREAARRRIDRQAEERANGR